MKKKVKLPVDYGVEGAKAAAALDEMNQAKRAFLRAFEQDMALAAVVWQITETPGKEGEGVVIAVSELRGRPARAAAAAVYGEMVPAEDIHRTHRLPGALAASAATLKQAARFNAAKAALKDVITAIPRARRAQVAHKADARLHLLHAYREVKCLDAVPQRLSFIWVRGMEAIQRMTPVKLANYVALERAHCAHAKDPANCLLSVDLALKTLAGHDPKDLVLIRPVALHPRVDVLYPGNIRRRGPIYASIPLLYPAGGEVDIYPLAPYQSHGAGRRRARRRDAIYDKRHPLIPGMALYVAKQAT